MVGIFWPFSGYTRAYPSLLKESLVSERDGAGDTEFEYEDDEEEDYSAVVVGFNCDLKPVEHPLEPVDDDRPATCPMASCSLLNGVSMGRRLGRVHKGAEIELLITNEENTAKKIPTVIANGGRPRKIRYPSAPPSSRNASGQLFSGIPMF